jgi:hypothetical protein
MRPVLLMMLATAVGCSGSGPTEVETPAPNPTTQATISLRNETSEPLVFLAAGEGTLALLDIPATLPPGSYEDRLVTPGETAPVTDVIGYDPKLGVNFFIWRVDRSSRVAYYARHHLATAAEIAAADGLVRITTFAP